MIDFFVTKYYQDEKGKRNIQVDVADASAIPTSVTPAAS